MSTLLLRAAPLTLFLLLAIGCAAPSAAPAYVTIAPDRYAAAFDAAVEAARARGLTGGLRDRRGGVIDTDPAFAPSLLEPWDPATVSLERSAESTLAFQRLRARFEFAPAGFEPDRRTAAGSPETADPGAAPDVLALAEGPRDLTQHEGEIELRVWVYVERSNRPGVRRSTWSRLETSWSTIVEHGPEGPQVAPASWTPIARDERLERSLLAEIQRAIGAAAN